MKQIIIIVADERTPLYRELVTQLGDKIASEKQMEDEHVDVFERARYALHILNKERNIKFKGDYAFLEQMGVEKLPGCTTLEDAYKTIDGNFPDWTFSDTQDPGKIIRRINVARRFLSAFTKGK